MFVIYKYIRLDKKTKTLCLSEKIKMASMTVSAADLAALEVLLNEFFATQTSNERKREIEQVTVFQNQ